MSNPRIRFHVGGPSFHPVADQAARISQWLGAAYQCEQRDGVDAFDDLDHCDLLVLMGLHWTGMNADWAGNMTYRPMQEHHKKAFEAYVASGRPMIAHHGAIASYDDWHRFGGLIGFTWMWEWTTHSHFGTHTVAMGKTGHPIIRDMADYTLEDELYYQVQVSADAVPTVHAWAEFAGIKRPMIMTLDRGVLASSGRVAYLANGHDMKAFECPAMKTLWINAVRWALTGQ